MNAIEPAARAFLARVARQYDVAEAILFGSRARCKSGSSETCNVVVARPAGQ